MFLQLRRAPPKIAIPEAARNRKTKKEKVFGFWSDLQPWVGMQQSEAEKVENLFCWIFLRVFETPPNPAGNRDSGSGTEPDNKLEALMRTGLRKIFNFFRPYIVASRIYSPHRAGNRDSGNGTEPDNKKRQSFQSLKWLATIGRHAAVGSGKSWKIISLNFSKCFWNSAKTRRK